MMHGGNNSYLLHTHERGCYCVIYKYIALEFVYQILNINGKELHMSGSVLCYEKTKPSPSPSY